MSNKDPGTGIQVGIFIKLPPGEVDPRMTWSFQRNHAGAVILRASNDGRAHVRLASASPLGPAGQSIYKGKMSDILLELPVRTHTS